MFVSTQGLHDFIFILCLHKVHEKTEKVKKFVFPYFLSSFLFFYLLQHRFPDMRSTLLYVLIAALLLCTVNAYGLTHKKNAKTVREIPIDEHIISVCPPTPFPPRIFPISLSPSLLSSSFPRWSTR